MPSTLFSLESRILFLDAIALKTSANKHSTYPMLSSQILIHGRIALSSFVELELIAISASARNVSYVTLPLLATCPRWIPD
jgi:hypothetical protein